MGYYDEDYEYEEEYYDYDDYIEPISIVANNCGEKEITDSLCATELITEKHARLECTMEKLIFAHGNQSEVYSMPEISFIESVEKVFVYTDFFMDLNQGKMACRVFATIIDVSGYDALKACVSFEKIVNKAFDGFNIFFFVTKDSVMFGCTVFDKTEKSDCFISKPIQNQAEFEQIQDEISFVCEIQNFKTFYSQFIQTITIDDNFDDYYENRIIKRRGMQFSYLEEMDSLGRETGLDTSFEKNRYRNGFETGLEISFQTLFEEVEESLSFIRSNRVNTYEMLFEADEMMKQAEETETINERLAQQSEEEPISNKSENDVEAEALLDDPEEMIKLLKKRRGI